MESCLNRARWWHLAIPTSWSSDNKICRRVLGRNRDCWGSLLLRVTSRGVWHDELVFTFYSSLPLTSCCVVLISDFILHFGRVFRPIYVARHFSVIDYMHVRVSQLDPPRCESVFKLCITHWRLLQRIEKIKHLPRCIIPHQIILEMMWPLLDNNKLHPIIVAAARYVNLLVFTLLLDCSS